MLTATAITGSVVAVTTSSNGNITLTPNGSGEVIIDGLKHPQADGNAGQVLKTDGSGQLAFASVSSLGWCWYSKCIR